MFKIYPTLIDAFKMFTDTDFITFEEMIDRINRVPRETPEAALKGTAYNNLIDTLVKGETPETGIIEPYRGEPYTGFKATAENREFLFDTDIALELAARLAGAVPQVFLKTTVDTPAGEVELYGYSDYILRDTVIDLKTTANYLWPKFLNSFQHRAYMVCGRDSGYDLTRFEYLVTDFRNIYLEDYYWTEKMREEVAADLVNFIRFLETNKHLITNEKIFGA